MTKSWTYRNTQSRLNIFVSSRIKECALERNIVKKAISEIRHRPILFEHLGSRSYSPRDLYLSQLNDADLMVGIYKAGYGYIAHDMDISGIEDEFQFAKKRNIRSLFYVHDGDLSREQKLEEMLNAIRNGPYTVSYYRDPSDLEERVKNDITAEIVSVYLKNDSRREVIEESAEDVLSRRSASEIKDKDDEVKLNEIYDLYKTNLVLCINGPSGSGKTNLVAKVSLRLKAIYVRATNLAPIDLFVVCANAINKPLEFKSAPLSLEEARGQFLEVWQKLETITLIVDENEFIQELIDSINTAGGFNESKRLIFTANESSSIYANYSLNASKVNSEFLYPSESSTAKELLHYIAINKLPLTASDLLSLRGDKQYSISQLMEDLRPFNSTLDDSPRGFVIKDENVIQIICKDIKQSPQLFKFYTNRLINLWEKEGNYRQVYWLASQLDDGSEKEYQNLAAVEATKLGDWKLGVSILSKMLAEAKDFESKSTAFELLISLIYPLELLGQTQKSTELLNEAKTLSLTLGELDQYKIQEIEISAKARKGIEVQDVEALKEIYTHYYEKGMEWDQARIGIELSAIYLGAKEYEEAIKVLEVALNIFTNLEDIYGLDLAEKNLVSALTAIDGDSKRINFLIGNIETRNKGISDKRRQRAWVCNIHTRLLRKAKKYKQAEILANEAISIAEDLGDECLKALNLINLGNIYRDQKLPKIALETYELAGISANKCGRKDIEADASRLSANVLNDFTDIEGITNNAEIAKNHALHAINLVKNGISSESLAYSYRELAEAYSRLGKNVLSSKAYFEAAKMFKKIPDVGSFEYALDAACASALPQHPKTYLTGLALVLNNESKDITEPFSERFIEAIPIMIKSTTKAIFIHLLVVHLYTVWSNTPALYRDALILRAIDKLISTLKEDQGNLEDWRILYAGIVFMYLLKEKLEPYVTNKLAKTVTDNVEDIYFRDEGDGSRTWTVVLNLNERVSISISPFDESHETNIACFALALFIKAFEKELNTDILAGASQIKEMSINIGRYDLFTEDIKATVSKLTNMEEVLSNQSASITRPTQYTEHTPTLIFLSNTFFKDFAFGENKGGALQILFGLTLTELAYQMMRGEVDQEVLRPKVVSLVRKTMH